MKKFSDLKINDQIYLIDERGRMLTVYVSVIYGDSIGYKGGDSEYTNHRSVNLHEASMIHSGVVSTKCQCASADYGILFATADYRKALKLAIIEERKIVKASLARQEVLTNNLAKDV